MYYENNLVSTLHLCKKMIEYDCDKIIFSSSATVYGDPEVLPITEDCKVGETTNPYGTTINTTEFSLPDNTNTRRLSTLKTVDENGHLIEQYKMSATTGNTAVPPSSKTILKRRASPHFYIRFFSEQSVRAD